jgi:pseudouridine synthase
VGISRRHADKLISSGKVTINDQPAELGKTVANDDVVKIDSKVVVAPDNKLTIMLNKPVGIVVSREGQGSKTVYDILPSEYQSLKPVGRLDKNSSGLLLLTNDGDLANKLTHPSNDKIKTYFVDINKPLSPEHEQTMNDEGVGLEDGVSHLGVIPRDNRRIRLSVSMTEGRNRQIRRTFRALGYEVIRLERRELANYSLGNLEAGEYKVV